MSIKWRIQLSIYMLLVILLTLSCRSTKHLLTQQIIASETLLNQHVGFCLYDLEAHQMVTTYKPNQYFVPASNIKLYTFLHSLSTLEDSIPTFRYVEKGDSLILWGCGDPSFLHPDLILQNEKIFNFLLHTPKQIFLVQEKQQPTFWAKGWQWDDYNNRYQTELNLLPIYGNIVQFQTDSISQQIITRPRYFESLLQTDSSRFTANGNIQRDFYTNLFYTSASKNATKQQIPFKTSLTLTAKLLTDTLKKTVNIITYQLPEQTKTLYGVATDSLYKKMLVESDNLIAEQLLIISNIHQNKHFSNTINKGTLTYLPQPYKWADGSGLSRLNLTTPLNTIVVLDSIYHKIGRERIKALFANGGVSGTLKNMYKDYPTFVFAKTGSMQGIYNQSGYVISAQGKWYAFSYLNNNFVESGEKVRQQVEKIIRWIHHNF